MLELPVNLFDCLFVTVLVAGVVAGRKHGISYELPRLLKWLALVIVCAAAYGPIGSLLARAGLFDPFASNLFSYLGCAFIVLVLFAGLQHKLKPRFEKSDAFGRGEYYLGMGSGLVRYGCMVFTLLALLNARHFSEAELKAKEQFQEQNFGSTVFPTLHNLQVAVFERSLTGSLISNYLSFLLIAPTSPEDPAPSLAFPPRIAGR